MMGLFKRGKKYEEVRKDVPITSFPLPADFIVPSVGDIYNVPVFPFPLKMVYDVAMYSDVVETINRALTNETFRNGIYIQERFKSKCIKCGAEYEEYVPICEECGGLTRKADLTERKKMKDWLANFRNVFGEDLITVLKQIDMDVNRIDNGYLVLLKEYYYTKDGRLMGYKVKDIVRGSPFGLYILISKYGMGRDNKGNYLYICPEHRTELVKKDKEGVYFCDKCGKQLIPAWYVMNDKGKTNYYAKDEIYHVKKWSNTQGYGMPWVLAVMTKVLTLMKMDRLMLKTYSLQRSPKGLLILRGRTDALIRAWEYLMQKSRENPNMIYPLVVEGGENQKKIIEYQDFTPKPEEFNWTEMRNEFRRQIGAVIGVQPLFQADLSTGGGLNNEGLQITITNRTIEVCQDTWNRVLDWLSYQLGYEDWRFRLYPNEEKDMKAQIERERMRIENARIMKDLGYEPILVEGVDGIEFRYKNVGTSNDTQNTYSKIRSVREMLDRSNGHGFNRDFEGSPEGSGRKANMQEYEGQPITKGYNDDKVPVRVVRGDGVQQTYYVARNRLKDFIRRHEERGQKVSVLGNYNIGENVGLEILVELMGDIMANDGDIDKNMELLLDRGLDMENAFGISLLAYLFDSGNIEILENIFKDYHGKETDKSVDELREFITDDVIEMWKEAVWTIFEKEYGDGIISYSVDNVKEELIKQIKAGSKVYVSDEDVMVGEIGEKPLSVYVKAKGNILWYEDGKAYVDGNKLEWNIPDDLRKRLIEANTGEMREDKSGGE